MKSNILTIMKKELFRFFGDKRMAFTTILMPGLMIFVIYSLMGDSMGKMFMPDESHVPTIAVTSLPESVSALAESADIPISEISNKQADDYRKQIAEQTWDLLAVFPEGFDEKVAAYSPASSEAAPEIALYYNSSSTESENTYQSFAALLNSYENALSNKFDINRSEGPFDLAMKEDLAAMVFSSMLPLLLMIFLYSGCIAVAPESIAGEKERGTIATLLITPLRRSELAIGKIAALALIALLSGLSSTIGTLLSLPKLMGAAGDMMDATIYGVTDYLMLVLVILSTVLVLITAISLISTFAKTVKEASTAVVPLMLITMLVGLSSMMGQGASKEMALYLIPLYNSVQCMTGIFSFDYQPACILITVLSNIIYTGIGVFALTRMFNSEKIMFNR